MSSFKIRFFVSFSEFVVTKWYLPLYLLCSSVSSVVLASLQGEEEKEEDEDEQDDVGNMSKTLLLLKGSVIVVGEEFGLEGVLSL